MAPLPSESLEPKTSCWPWSHRWTKWADGPAMSEHSPKDGRMVGMFVIQDRLCVNCNKLQARRVNK